ncbi:MAG: cupredoxin domain-containing protein [Gemmatimonadetes bacterium]|nr:cupredoxin domain-containing protein [Gemmatimonadota bacterium]
MTPLDAVIAIAALVFIAWELWFFLPRPTRAAPPEVAKALAQEFQITVRSGFAPDVIVVEPQRSVRLHVYRSETDPRSEELTFDALDIAKKLPEFETTTIEFIVAEAADYRFTCGGAEGRIVAQPGGSAARANLGRGHQKHG